MYSAVLRPSSNNSALTYNSEYFQIYIHNFAYVYYTLYIICLNTYVHMHACTRTHTDIICKTQIYTCIRMYAYTQVDIKSFLRVFFLIRGGLNLT